MHSAPTKRHREQRPGVEAADPHYTKPGVRYRVVTQGQLTFHETFAEAADEYWWRRTAAGAWRQ